MIRSHWEGSTFEHSYAKQEILEDYIKHVHTEKVLDLGTAMEFKQDEANDLYAPWNKQFSFHLVQNEWETIQIRASHSQFNYFH